MSSNRETAALVEAALLTAITSILAIAGIYIPFLGYLMFIIAVPFIILMVRHNWKYAVIATIASAVLVTFVSFPTYGIYVAVLGGFVGMVIGYFIKNGKDSSYAIFYGGLAAIVSFIALLSLMTLITGVTLSSMVEEILAASYKMTESMGFEEVFSQSGIQLNDMLELFKMILPSALIISAVVFAFVNYAVANIIMRRAGMKIGSPKKFSEFVLPSNILTGTSIILILAYFSGKMNIVDSQMLFMNVLNLFVYIFFIQGLAIVFSYFEKRNLKRVMKIIIVILIFLLQMTLTIAILGWIDNIFDFRKIRKKKLGV
ncbi:MAG: YybS family protein [Clostridiales bacterium]|nr:YybS family protein [Clostridiales bacterium]